jgi:Fe-S-cluster-containing hydrogenase component 2
MQFIVTTEKCTGCGTCTEICPTEAIRTESGKAWITMECIGCGACPRVCPEGAIKMGMSPVPAASLDPVSE